ncbi:NUDIX hydrolase [Hydrogenophaga sp.]|uniref:NUDIX hydrolase n=1 Tax=Hydrogenophaga sp. TaxID=1904254 RepID=UPI00272581F2|nr:NUDIX hydrolase [Hydrogenophaga sp.]MDO8905245.1 NUDIX hydrolase [Hydrogenophaga sp.]
MALAINSDIVNTPPVPAATVMVVRDGERGLEVLLVRRHANSGVLGGVHVFPGGKLDAADRQVAAAALDRPVADCLQALGEADLDAGTAVGLHVAALRETFEECGLLLGLQGAQGLVARLRQQTQNGTAFGDAVQALGLVLPVSSLLPWSRWVTPRVPSVTNKRFDTRFFMAVAPSDQEAEHCTFEATEAVWLSPRAGLERFWAGEIDLAPPQIMSLCQLGGLADVAQVQAAARSRAPVLIAPEPFDVDGQRVICYPGDPSHSCADRAWPGPTRLIYRNQRFEPDGGLAALFV